MSNQHAQQVTIEQLEDYVKKRDRLHKLMNNREFKDLFLEGYFKDHAVRLVGISALASTEPRHDAIVAEIKAISLTQDYLHTIEMMGNQAETSLKDYREEYGNEDDAAAAEV